MVLADLARHPGWGILEQRMIKRHAEETSTLANHILWTDQEIDALKIARARGFWAGQRWMLRHAKSELVALKKQEQGADSALAANR